jgi:hypothetical protein
MMAERKPRKTPEEIVEERKQAYIDAKTAVKSKARKEEAHKAILIGKSLQARANNGNAASKQELAAILDGFTRDQDRRAFGLDPLPGNPPADPSAKPPSAADIAAATARYEDARVAFNKGRGTVESARLQAAFVEATITLERLTGSLVGITPENRKAFGLGDNPGERLNNG